jgi:hypothetical protein
VGVVVTRTSLLINGVPVPDGPRWRPLPPEPPTPEQLEAEALRSMADALGMRRGVLLRGQHGPVTWWQEAPTYSAPATVSGEIPRPGCGTPTLHRLRACACEARG